VDDAFAYPEPFKFLMTLWGVYAAPRWRAPATERMRHTAPPAPAPRDAGGRVADPLVTFLRMALPGRPPEVRN